MRKTNIQKAKEIGKSFATSLFNDFVKHPEYKGINFFWETFPDMCYKLGYVQCFLEFPYKVKNLEKLKKVFASSSKRQAKVLLKTL